MIEISFGKLVLLALVALIVLGPEKLPHAARTAGVFLRRVRAEVERELQVEEIRRQAREAASKAEAAQAELDETLRKMRPEGVPSRPSAPPVAEPVAEPVADVAAAATPTKEAPHGGA
jgi:sec-independent protein translocase protein TatB